MYFGLTNSPATFQAMMNDLFRDMINKENIATFIDDVLVATETEKGHNKIVEEVLRQLEENNLYVKPEKCVWKVREIGGDNGTRRVPNRERKGGESHKLADTAVHQEYTKVPRTGKLLLAIC